MYEKIIDKLKRNNVLLDTGLANDEIKKIELMYNLKFPSDLVKLYSMFVPVGEGYYNWRDFSSTNIIKIKDKIDSPFVGIKKHLSQISWNEAWGIEPESEFERSKYISLILDRLPRLIPIYKHRYMATQYESGNPVFLIYDLDVICYGKNLEQYFEIELKYKKQSFMDYSNVKKIEFWSDLL